MPDLVQRQSSASDYYTASEEVVSSTSQTKISSKELSMKRSRSTKSWKKPTPQQVVRTLMKDVYIKSKHSQRKNPIGGLEEVFKYDAIKIQDAVTATLIQNISLTQEKFSLFLKVTEFLRGILETHGASGLKNNQYSEVITIIFDSRQRPYYKLKLLASPKVVQQVHQYPKLASDLLAQKVQPSVIFQVLCCKLLITTQLSHKAFYSFILKNLVLPKKCEKHEFYELFLEAVKNTISNLEHLVRNPNSPLLDKLSEQDYQWLLHQLPAFSEGVSSLPKKITLVDITKVILKKDLFDTKIQAINNLLLDIKDFYYGEVLKYPNEYYRDIIDVRFERSVTPPASILIPPSSVSIASSSLKRKRRFCQNEHSASELPPVIFFQKNYENTQSPQQAQTINNYNAPCK
jgi:hypothetical protein